MVSMKRQLVRRSKSSSSPQNGKVRLWISRRACELNSVWLTEGREKMRKAATTIFVLVLSGLGTLTATAGPKPADQARTMSDRSEEHTSELQSLRHLVCRLLLEKKKK